MTWREVLHDAEVADGLTELFDELERCGWIARRRFGAKGLAFWPDNARGRQFVVPIDYPLNDHKLETYRDHTKLALEVLQKEGTDEH